MKTQLSSNQTTLNHTKNSIDKITQEIKSLENLQMKLEENQTYDSLIKEVSIKISDYENKIDKAVKEAKEETDKELVKKDRNITIYANS